MEGLSSRRGDNGEAASLPTRLCKRDNLGISEPMEGSQGGHVESTASIYWDLWILAFFDPRQLFGNYGLNGLVGIAATALFQE